MSQDIAWNPWDVPFPAAVDPEMVGKYPARAHAGGGYAWDEVLEYRVWCYLGRGTEDVADEDDYFYAFGTYEEAKAASARLVGAKEPLALVRQVEYIDETEAGDYRHVRQERVTEWPVEFLSRPNRDDRTIPEFLAVDAPPNRLAILRGEAPRPTA
ncbi:hypothetical protein FBY23_1718 [Nocardioides sp. SLBN-35]|nr:hypothetical protein FBY23_1718 [Nocardioides sp. SLBN-35]